MSIVCNQIRVMCIDTLSSLGQNLKMISTYWNLKSLKELLRLYQIRMKISLLLYHPAQSWCLSHQSLRLSRINNQISLLTLEIFIMQEQISLATRISYSHITNNSNHLSREVYMRMYLKSTHLMIMMWGQTMLMVCHLPFLKLSRLIR